MKVCIVQSVYNVLMSMSGVYRMCNVCCKLVLYNVNIHQAYVHMFRRLTGKRSPHSKKKEGGYYNYVDITGWWVWGEIILCGVATGDLLVSSTYVL